MAVNGIEIQAGQVWRTRGGDAVTVIDDGGVPAYPWRLTNSDSVTNAGEYYSESPQNEDLIELLVGDTHEALTFGELPFPELPEISLPPEQRSNPKDAIGDKKLPLHLCSPIAEAHWAIGQYAGLLKYGAWNWRAAGVRASVYIAAMNRHLAAYVSGEEFDPVDGSHHLGNIMACSAILLDAREIGKLTDDRPPSYSIRPTYKWAEGVMATLKVQYADMAPRHYTIADTEVAA